MGWSCTPTATSPKVKAAAPALLKSSRPFKGQIPVDHRVGTYDLEDPVVFSRYAAEHATGSATADILIASAPNLWTAAVKKGYVQELHPGRHRGLPQLRLAGRRPVHHVAATRR